MTEVSWTMRFLATAVAGVLSTSANAQSAPVRSGTDATGSAGIKCKTRTVTGSLAKTVKECHTAAEWDAINSRGQADADYYRQTMNSSRSN